MLYVDIIVDGSKEGGRVEDITDESEVDAKDVSLVELCCVANVEVMDV